MMDKGKILQAQELLKDSGATTVVLIVNDGDYQSALLNGMGIDIVKALLATMKKDELFAFLVGVALSQHLDGKEENTHNNKNNKQHGKQHKN